MTSAVGAGNNDDKKISSAKKQQWVLENGLEKEVDVSPAEGQWGVRHFQAFLFFLGMFIAYGHRVCFSIAILGMEEDFGWLSREKSMMLSAFFWGYVLTQVPAGQLAGRWSARKILVIGMLLCGVATAAIPWFVTADRPWVVLLARFLMGFGQGAVLPGIHTLLAKWVPKGERARLGSFAYSGGQLGTVVAMPISAQLSTTPIGWAAVFYFYGALCALWALLFQLCGSDGPQVHPRIGDVERLYILNNTDGASNGSSNAEKPATPWGSIFSSVPMWALIIVHCGQNWGFWFLMGYLPTYMQNIGGFAMEKTGFYAALPYLAMWLLSFPCSYLADLALRRRVQVGTIRKVSNSVAHWGPGLALIGLCFVKDQAGMVALLTVAVGLNAGSICGYQINHIDLSPNFAGTMMSITNCLASVVAIVAPFVCALVITDEKNASQWHIVFGITAFIYFAGNLCFVVFGSGRVQSWNEPPAKSEKSQKDELSTNL
ncbi:hypothetical protein TKK_0003770 [Trichogramma kaykai]